jgi:hypothetical protein
MNGDWLGKLGNQILELVITGASDASYSEEDERHAVLASNQAR